MKTLVIIQCTCIYFGNNKKNPWVLFVLKKDTEKMNTSHLSELKKMDSSVCIGIKASTLLDTSRLNQHTCSSSM